MSYILISLWSADDDATTRSNTFSMELNRRHPAASVFAGPAPCLEAIREAAEAARDSPVVIFGHGGAALCAHRDGSGAITAPALAMALSGRRVYAFACSTFRPQPALTLRHFAEVAVESCIEVFVGHEAPVMTPLLADGDQDNPVLPKLLDALVALVMAFVGGEDDAQSLQRVGMDHADWDSPIEIDLPSEDPSSNGAFGWSSAAYLGTVFNSVRTERKS